MKKIYNLFVVAVCIYASTQKTVAQCPGSYTQAQLNWDNLDYYFNSGLNVAPYGYRVSSTNFTYVSDAHEQTQRFAIGSNFLSIATSNAAVINPGAGASAENTTHTGELAGYTGADAQYNPSANGQTITITFDTPVRNASFTLYDIDLAAVVTVTAADAAAVPLLVNAAVQPGSILTVAGAPGKVMSDLTNAGAGTALANASNLGSVTITIPGTLLNPVKTITITCTAIGTDPVFWLSDLNACVSATFPTNWHQGFNNRPLQGFTQNQPDYFIVTPDNKSAYMMDPATGRCWWLFSETTSPPYINTFAYDPSNKYLYYVTDGSGTPRNNKTLKRYNFNTEAIETVMPDISASLNMPTFDQGVESAAAAFYNDVLYLGIEGGRHGSGGSTVTRESIIWAITFNAGVPNSASQVVSFEAYRAATDSTLNDWADFIIKNGTLYNYNTARAGSSPITYKYSSYNHFDMMTGNMTATYLNPNPDLSVRFTGQSGMTWAQELYFVRDSVGKYNENGTNSTTLYRAVVQSVPGDPAPPAWVGAAGDASDPFRPKCDFGDAPATYDPNSLSPAAHERSETIRLGATWTREWLKTGVTGNNDSDDGNSYVNFLPQGTGNYLAYTYASNSSGANATLIAWLDYNGNGVFDAAEATAAQTVPNGASNQLFWLYWSGFTTPLVNGQTTYMRIRITSASAGMTSAHATGYFTNGEVEDYLIPVDNYPLSVLTLSFNASMVNNSYTKLNWTAVEQTGFGGYEIQKSTDAVNWQFVGLTAGNSQAGEHSYEFIDQNPAFGRTYYRLKLIGATNNKYSETKYVNRLNPEKTVIVKPNPVKNTATISIEANERTVADIALFTEAGKQVFSDKKTIGSGINLVQINVKPEWPAGSYILRVTMNNESISKKMIIEK